MRDRKRAIKLLSVIAFILSIGTMSWTVYGSDEKDITYSIQEELIEEGTKAKLVLEITPNDRVEELSSITLPDESVIEKQKSIIYEVTENKEYEFIVQYKILKENENEEVIETTKLEVITYQEENIQTKVEEDIKKEDKGIEDVPVEESPLVESSNEVNSATQLAVGDISIDAEHFPDENFRNYLLKDITDIKGYGKDKVFTATELANITRIYVYGKNIRTLKGLEYFTALTKLYCGGNQLTELDVSGHTALIVLSCARNQLTELDISQNTALTELDCTRNQLTELDISQNTALTRLESYINPLTELDVSQNTALKVFYCSYNQLTELDISQNTALRELQCDNNQLTELNISQHTALFSLFCGNNQLTELNISQNTALVYLFCGNNQLTELDISRNTTLIQLNCSNNQLTELNISKNTAVEYLSCENNQLTTLDLSNIAKLSTFIGTGQKIEVPMFYNNTSWMSHPNTNYGISSIDNTNITYSGGQFISNNTAAKSSNFTTDCIDGKNTTRQVSGTLSFIYESFVPVSNIKDVPKTILVNQTVTLSGTVEPSNATVKNIIWSIKDSGTTNATIMNNNLTVSASGTLVLTATIPGGIKTRDYTQDFTIVVCASPSVFVSIPTKIELEKAYHDEIFEAVKEEQVSILSTTDTNVFNSNFYVRTEPTFHLLNTVDKDEWFTVQIYNEDNNKHTSKDMPLAILNSTRLSQRFYVKAKKDIRKSKGSYQGTMNFVIGYGENQ